MSSRPSLDMKCLFTVQGCLLQSLGLECLRARSSFATFFSFSSWGKGAGTAPRCPSLAPGLTNKRCDCPRLSPVGTFSTAQSLLRIPYSITYRGCK
ncbi:hypothetical protein BJY00DRAFT_129866 [Aspergillus carlsbadensis]|nr:hypothetical protein BJY00DRAFT_129866 [Aspergillus carlsbadensis]